MILHDKNCSTINVDNALNTNEGFSMQDTPKTRQAVKKGVTRIVFQLHADKHGVSLQEFLDNKAYYVERGSKGLWAND